MFLSIPIGRTAPNFQFIFDRVPSHRTAYWVPPPRSAAPFHDWPHNTRRTSYDIDSVFRTTTTPTHQPATVVRTLGMRARPADHTSTPTRLQASARQRKRSLSSTISDCGHCMRQIPGERVRKRPTDILTERAQSSHHFLSTHADQRASPRTFQVQARHRLLPRTRINSLSGCLRLCTE